MLFHLSPVVYSFRVSFLDVWFPFACLSSFYRQHSVFAICDCEGKASDATKIYSIDQDAAVFVLSLGEGRPQFFHERTLMFSILSLIRTVLCPQSCIFLIQRCVWLAQNSDENLSILLDYVSFLFMHEKQTHWTASIILPAVFCLTELKQHPKDKHCYTARRPYFHWNAYLSANFPVRGHFARIRMENILRGEIRIWLDEDFVKITSCTVHATLSGKCWSF